MEASSHRPPDVSLLRGEPILFCKQSRTYSMIYKITLVNSQKIVQTFSTDYGQLRCTEFENDIRLSLSGQVFENF